MSSLRRVVSKKELEEKRNCDSITDALEVDPDDYSRVVAETFGKLIEAMLKPTKLESAYLLLEYLGLDRDQITVERLIKMLTIYYHIQDLYELVVARIVRDDEVRASTVPFLAAKIQQILENDEYRDDSNMFA